MTTVRLFPIALAAATLTLGIQVATAATSTPAITAFNTAFAKVTDYTYTLHSHEVKGSDTRDAVYEYSFLRPHYAKSSVISGHGKGGGAVWVGGDQVSGHQGGFMSGMHQKVSIHDPRAVSLLGYTITDGLMQNVVATLTTIPGTLSERDSGTVNGVATDLVTLEMANPATVPNNVTRQQVYFSRATHWPVRAISWVGDKPIQDQSFSDIKTNVGLKPSDFPF